MFGFGKATESFVEKRATPFQEWLSKFMVRTASLGAAYVLVDPRLTATDSSLAFVMNSGGFSNDLKGMVIGAILVGGFSSVREFWLGTSKGGQEQAASQARIAETVSAKIPTPSVASALTPIIGEVKDMTVTAETVSVTKENP